LLKRHIIYACVSNGGALSNLCCDINLDDQNEVFLDISQNSMVNDSIYYQLWIK